MKLIRILTASMLILASSPALALKYRIDPQPRTPSPESYVTNPWQLLAAPARSTMLTLLNFVLADEPDQLEGVDYPDYNRRAQFGTWIKATPEVNCYNTRAKILIRDSSAPVVFAENNPCRVTEGRWHDVYTGQEFVEARDVQIDHVVPLKNAYNSGAYKWDKQRRCHYANFINYDSHLITVSGRENMRKGDRTPARYMPPDASFACGYLQRWLNVKAVWNLELDPDEVAEIQKLMQVHRCTLRFQTVTEASLRSLRAQAERIEPSCARLH